MIDVQGAFECNANLGRHQRLDVTIKLRYGIQRDTQSAMSAIYICQVRLKEVAGWFTCLIARHQPPQDHKRGPFSLLVRRKLLSFRQAHYLL